MLVVTEHQDNWDPGYLQEEANRVAQEKFSPLLDELEETLELKYKEGARDVLLYALIKALQEGVRLGAIDTHARLQPYLREGVHVVPEFLLDGMDDPLPGDEE